VAYASECPSGGPDRCLTRVCEHRLTLSCPRQRLPKTKLEKQMSSMFGISNIKQSIWLVSASCFDLHPTTQPHVQYSSCPGKQCQQLLCCFTLQRFIIYQPSSAALSPAALLAAAARDRDSSNCSSSSSCRKGLFCGFAAAGLLHASAAKAAESDEDDAVHIGCNATAKIGHSYHTACRCCAAAMCHMVGLGSNACSQP
jgi:hypothetical protein